MARVALLSNPRSTGNRSLLPRVRAFCAEHRDVFHYEVESVDQIGDALRTIQNAIGPVSLASEQLVVRGRRSAVAADRHARHPSYF